MTRKQRLDRSGLALIAFCLFGLALCFGIAYRSDANRKLPADDGRRYELQTTIDGRDYVVDEDLTRDDCMQMLHKVTEWTEGHDSYRCVRLPIAR